MYAVISVPPKEGKPGGVTEDQWRADTHSECLSRLSEWRKGNDPKEKTGDRTADETPGINAVNLKRITANSRTEH